MKIIPLKNNLTIFKNEILIFHNPAIHGWEQETQIIVSKGVHALPERIIICAE